MKAFDGQTAVVTGASSGIGRAIALELAEGGAALHLLGRDPARIAEAAAECRSAAVSTHAFDLTGDEALLAAARAIAARSPKLDLLIHAAGVITLGPIAGAPIADLDLNYRVNLRAPVLLTQALLQNVLDARGQIVLVNSGAGLTARAGWCHYAASKHGLKAFADSLREEVKPRGVRVLTVYPGRTATPMQARTRALEGKPYDPGEMIRPEDVSAMVCRALALPRTADVVEINIRQGAAP